MSGVPRVDDDKLIAAVSGRVSRIVHRIEPTQVDDLFLLHHAIRDNPDEVQGKKWLETLILRCAGNVNLLNDHGYSPLHECVARRSVMLIKYLNSCQKGLNPNVLSRDSEFGGTPLHLAASLKAPAEFQALLDIGADPTVEDKEGYTAHQLAMASGDEKIIRASVVAHVSRGLPVPEDSAHAVDDILWRGREDYADGRINPARRVLRANRAVRAMQRARGSPSVDSARSQDLGSAVQAARLASVRRSQKKADPIVLTPSRLARSVRAPTNSNRASAAPQTVLDLFAQKFPDEALSQRGHRRIRSTGSGVDYASGDSDYFSSHSVRANTNSQRAISRAQTGSPSEHGRIADDDRESVVSSAPETVDDVLSHKTDHLISQRGNTMPPPLATQSHRRQASAPAIRPNLLPPALVPRPMEADLRSHSSVSTIGAHSRRTQSGISPLTIPLPHDAMRILLRDSKTKQTSLTALVEHMRPWGIESKDDVELLVQAYPMFFEMEVDVEHNTTYVKLIEDGPVDDAEARKANDSVAKTQSGRALSSEYWRRKLRSATVGGSIAPVQSRSDAQSDRPVRSESEVLQVWTKGMRWEAMPWNRVDWKIWFQENWIWVCLIVVLIFVIVLVISLGVG